LERIKILFFNFLKIFFFLKQYNHHAQYNQLCLLTQKWFAKAELDTQRVHFKTCLNAKMLAWLLANISTGKLSCLTKQNNTGKLENNLSPSN